MTEIQDLPIPAAGLLIIGDGRTTMRIYHRVLGGEAVSSGIHRVLGGEAVSSGIEFAIWPESQLENVPMMFDPETYPGPQLCLEFTNLRAVDVLINALLEAREKLVE